MHGRHFQNRQAPNVVIPESEVSASFARSSGAGGQNVNKVETKVRLNWDIKETGILTDEQKELVFERLGHRINKEGELFVVCEETRSRERNREEAMAKLNELVNDALYVDPTRNIDMPKKVEFKVKAVSKDVKQRRHQKKQLRKDVREWD